jgi:hypothetical protein
MSGATIYRIAVQWCLGYQDSIVNSVNKLFANLVCGLIKNRSVVAQKTKVFEFCRVNKGLKFKLAHKTAIEVMHENAKRRCRKRLNNPPD